MRNYDTVENYLRVYGGPVSAKVQMDNLGKLEVEFSRPIVYPERFIAKFDSDYKERVPVLTPTEEELDAIEKEFEEMQEAQANGISLGMVQRTRTVCENITVSVETSS